MWKVIVMFNEPLYEDEEESTIVKEKIFDTYWGMRDYVATCESHGAVGGIVMKYHSDVDTWTYYMDVQ